MKKIYSYILLYVICINYSFANNPPVTSVDCVIPAPIDASSCSTPLGTRIIGGLPATGTWTLYRSLNGGVFVPITGTGTTYTDTGLNQTSGYCYQYKVTDSNGCTSSATYVCVGYMNGLSGTMTGTYIDYNNDGITNIGDIIQYSLTVTNGTVCPMDVTYGLNGTFTPTGTITNLAVGATNTVVFQYALTQDDIMAASVDNWIALEGVSASGYYGYDKVFASNPVTLAISDGIKLNAFYDTNNNGIQNAGEANAIQGQFSYVLNGGPVIHSYTSSGTLTIYETNPANTYNLNYSLFNDCSGQYTLASNTYNNITVAAGSGITTYNFPIIQNACQDLQIYIIGQNPRPGFSHHNYIYYRNSGNQTLASGTVTFTKDNSLSISDVSVSGTTPTANGFTYNFTNLLPNQTRFIDITLDAPVTLNIGDIVTNTSLITTPAADTNPANNTDALTTTVSNSLDPNDKQENHGGKILHSSFTSNDYLTYTIRFENVGNADAINIRINDVLDTKLDESSIKMLTASHPYVLERVGRNLDWKFSGIDLPPSLGSATVGHGFITFQIKPKPGYAVGDIIRNTANIYFDFNPAIVTNTTHTEFVNTLATNQFVFDNLESYPNPTTDYVTITNATTIENVEIISILGQKIKSFQVDDVQAQIDFSELTNGIYFVKIKSQNQEKTNKIVKK